MGTWGKDLYKDDYVLDIRNDYIEGLKEGETADKLNERLVKYYACKNSDENESLTFWIVLADVQWEYGRLAEEIKRKAVEILSNEKMFDKWAAGFGELRDARKNQGLKILEKIQSPQPKIKRISNRKSVSDNWYIGDVFQYKIVMGDEEKYLYYVKCGEDVVNNNLIGSEIMLYRGIYERPQKFEELIKKMFCPVYPPKYYENKDVLDGTFDGVGLLYKGGIIYRLLIVSRITKKVAANIKHIGNIDLDTSRLHEPIVRIIDDRAYNAVSFDMNRFAYNKELKCYLKQSNKLVHMKFFDEIVSDLLLNWEGHYSIVDKYYK